MSRPAAIEPEVATVLGSYNCTAACESCCFDSRPGIRERLSRSEILRFIDQAAALGTVRLIVFSGGESFLLGKDLEEAVRHAARAGLKTRCVSNGYWARTPEGARARLGPLRDAGLGELNVSTGDFHQAFVPRESVINAAVAGLDLGLDVVVMVEIHKGRAVTAKDILGDARLARAVRRKGRPIFRVIESPWAPTTVLGTVPQEAGLLADRGNVHRKEGCDSVLSTIVATPDRRLGLCCGLTRESIPELNVPLPAGDLKDALDAAAGDFMKIWLFVEGPEKILAWAAAKDPKIEWEGRYAHRCHACLAIFRQRRVKDAIRRHYREKVSEVLLRYSIVSKVRSRRPPEVPA